MPETAALQLELQRIRHELWARHFQLEYFGRTGLKPEIRPGADPIRDIEQFTAQAQVGVQYYYYPCEYWPEAYWSTYEPVVDEFFPGTQAYLADNVWISEQLGVPVRPGEPELWILALTQGSDCEVWNNLR